MKKKNLLMTAMAIFGLATITFAQTVPSYVPTTGLVGWWPFNGNANDESGNGNNGTNNGATQTTDRNGNVNSAYSFNGVNNYIVTNSLLDASQDFSFSCWVNSNSNSDQVIFNTIPHTIISFVLNPFWGGAGTIGFLYGTGLSAGWLNNSYYFSNPNLYQGVWVNHLIVKNGLNWKFYQNGVLIHNYNAPSNPASTISQLVFGHCDPSVCIEAFSGKIDDIGIWNRALTQLEISALYNGCSASVTIQPINQSVNISNNAQFTTASSDSMATYQWQTDLGFGYASFNSIGQYSGTANDTLTIVNTTLTNNNQPFRCIVSTGCSTDTSAVAILTVLNNTGINEVSQSNLFSVYPNPANSQINVKVDSKLLGSDYTVYDNTGKVVLSGKIISENTVIELGNLPGGIYLLSVGENLKKTFIVTKE
jgi:hypothetical protein